MNYRIGLACIIGILALSACREDGNDSGGSSRGPSAGAGSGQTNGGADSAGGASTGSNSNGGNTSGSSSNGGNSSGGNSSGSGRPGGSSNGSNGAGGGTSSGSTSNSGERMNSTTEAVNVINFFQVSVELPVITIQRENEEIWNLEVPESFDGPVTSTAIFINSSRDFGGAGSALRLTDGETLRVLSARRIL